MSVIDPPKCKVVATIALGSGPEFAGADCKGMLFVNLEDKSETLAIDVQTNTVTHRWPLAPGESPSGLAVDGGKGRVFADYRNEQMVVLDAASGKMLATPAIGQGVDACVFDPGTGFAFASCGDGTLTVVKEEAGSFLVVEKIPTRKAGRTMALDPVTHAVYLPTAEFEPALAVGPGQGRATQDGSRQLHGAQIRALTHGATRLDGPVEMFGKSMWRFCFHRVPCQNRQAPGGRSLRIKMHEFAFALQPHLPVACLR